MVDLSSDKLEWEDTTPNLWLTDIEGELATSEDTIPLLNKKAAGYYRVNYTPDIWSQIADILMTNHEIIHPFNRAQIKNMVLNYVDMEEDFGPLIAYGTCTNYGIKSK